MGYYSGVCFEIRAKKGASKAVFDRIAVKAKNLIKPDDQEATAALDRILPVCVRGMDEGVAVLRFYDGCNKWYEDDDRAMSALRDAANDEDCGVAFLRIGEENGDIEEYTDDGMDSISYSVVICPAWRKDYVLLDEYHVASLIGVSRFEISQKQLETLCEVGNKAARDAIVVESRQMGLFRKRETA